MNLCPWTVPRCFEGLYGTTERYLTATARVEKDGRTRAWRKGRHNELPVACLLTREASAISPMRLA